MNNTNRESTPTVNKRRPKVLTAEEIATLEAEVGRKVVRSVNVYDNNYRRFHENPEVDEVSVISAFSRQFTGPFKCVRPGHETYHHNVSYRIFKDDKEQRAKCMVVEFEDDGANDIRVVDSTGKIVIDGATRSVAEAVCSALNHEAPYLADAIDFGVGTPVTMAHSIGVDNNKGTYTFYCIELHGSHINEDGKKVLDPKPRYLAPMRAIPSFPPATSNPLCAIKTRSLSGANKLIEIFKSRILNNPRMVKLLDEHRAKYNGGFNDYDTLKAVEVHYSYNVVQVKQPAESK